MPSRAEGPPHAGFWGNRALYDPEKAVALGQEPFQDELALSGVTRDDKSRDGGRKS